MAFRWRQDPVGGTASPDLAVTVEPGTTCPSLVKALGRVLRQEKPRILDLGSQCGATAVALANRGAHVTVDEVCFPEEAPPRESDDETPVAAPPYRLEYEDGSFDLILAWEMFDFVDPVRLDEVGRELGRILAPKGWLLLFARSSGRHNPEPEALPLYRMTAEDRLIREEFPGPLRPRWAHPTRRVEAALKPLQVQGIHLQRNQLREFLSVKP